MTQHPNLIKTESDRMPVLDGIRGTAALMVMAFHYKQGMGSFDLGNGWFNKSTKILEIGQTGVDLFFVLSGFLITGILLNAKGSLRFLLNFYMRRALRILPLYYFVVVGCIVAGFITSEPKYAFDKCWWFLVYFQNIGTTFWPSLVGGPGHFWSLGVEEHFYLLWPFLILAFDEKRLPQVLSVSVAVGITCRLVLLSINYDVFTFSLCRMDALSMGAMLAVLFRTDGLALRVSRICFWTLVLMVPVMIAIYPLLSGAQLFLMQVVKYSLVALGYTALVGIAVGPGRSAFVEKIFNNRLLCWCGAYSYAMYVFHPFVYGIVMRRMRHSELVHTNPVLCMAIELSQCIALTLLVSWLSWHLIEKRFLAFKHYFEYRRHSESPAPPVALASAKTPSL